MTETTIRAKTSNSTNPRFALIDLTRLFAAVAVLFYHFTARTSVAWDHALPREFPGLFPLSKYGFLGVEVFFVISGFVILLSAVGRTPQKFIASRVSRIYPAYWAGVILTSILLLFVWPGGKDISFSDSLVNLTMFQDPLGAEHVDGVYWTLWVELRFYALLLLLILVGLTIQKVVLLIAFWAPVATLLQGLGSDVVDAFLMPEYAPLFSVGMALYLLTKDRTNIILWMLAASNAIFSVFQLNGGARLRAEDVTTVDISPTVSAGLLALSIVCLFLFALTPLRHVSAKWMTPLGLLTYPLYLVHEHWGWWVISRLDQMPKSVALTAAIAFSFLLAWAIHLCVERPFGKRFRDLLLNALNRFSTPIAQASPDATSRTVGAASGRRVSVSDDA